jgi:hypothetical protein
VGPRDVITFDTGINEEVLQVMSKSPIHPLKGSKGQAGTASVRRCAWGRQHRGRSVHAVTIDKQEVECQPFEKR